VELTQRILESAPNVKATFHHAFEEAKDQGEALEKIKSLSQVDRILSHGGKEDLNERVQRLDRYHELAGEQLTILAGGGIDADAILKIGETTAIREFHVGRAVRFQFQVEGNVQASLVSKLVHALKELS
jgi:copper homeostasis protein